MEMIEMINNNNEFKPTSKKEFMEIYNKATNNEIDLENIDTETLYKIMILLNEEVNMLKQKATDELHIAQDMLNDLKISVFKATQN